MSELKVNKISPRSGTGVTLGDSGDTVTVASGASFASTGIDDNATSTAITIDSSERVGIGTASPSNTLEIAGSGTPININSTNDEVKKIQFENSGVIQGYYGCSSGTPMRILNGSSTELMRIDSSGNVGIGTSSPSSQSGDANTLVVGSGSGNKGLTIYSGTTSNGAIRFSDGTSGADTYRGQIDYDHNDNSLKFVTDTSERMRIDSSGNVGVRSSGATTPTYDFSTLGEGLFQRYWDQSGARHADLVAIGNTPAGATQDMRFFTNSGGAPGTATERMRIDSSGNVGIGSTSISVPAGYSRFLAIGDTNTGIGQISSDVLGLATGGVDRFRIKSNGDIEVNNVGTPHSQNTSGAFKIYGLGSGAGVVGLTSIARFQDPPLLVNRVGNDGALVEFYGEGTQEGSISVSGTTVSYNGFTGSHWSRFIDESKPDVLRGTVMESLDQMTDWYHAEFENILYRTRRRWK
jgi:hypothetical protein